MFHKLKQRWQVTSNLQFIRIFTVFALTGSSSAKLTGPLLKSFPAIAELDALSFNVLYILATFVLYQFLLLLIGWIFGESTFFIQFLNKFFFRKRKWKRLTEQLTEYD